MQHLLGLEMIVPAGGMEIGSLGIELCRANGIYFYLPFEYKNALWIAVVLGRELGWAVGRPITVQWISRLEI